LNEIINGITDGDPLKYFRDFWNALDIINLSFFVFSIVWRVKCVPNVFLMCSYVFLIDIHIGYQSLLHRVLYMYMCVCVCVYIYIVG